jgi:hypothetical protein
MSDVVFTSAKPPTRQDRPRVLLVSPNTRLHAHLCAYLALRRVGCRSAMSVREVERALAFGAPRLVVVDAALADEELGVLLANLRRERLAFVVLASASQRFRALACEPGAILDAGLRVEELADLIEARVAAGRRRACEATLDRETWLLDGPSLLAELDRMFRRSDLDGQSVGLVLLEVTTVEGRPPTSRLDVAAELLSQVRQDDVVASLDATCFAVAVTCPRAADVLRACSRISAALAEALARHGLVVRTGTATSHARRGGLHADELLELARLELDIQPRASRVAG